MFVGSFRPAGVLTEKELCRGEAALAHLYYGYLRWSRTVFRGEASDSSATSALDGLGVSVSVLPSNFPLGEPVKRMDAPSTREPCQGGRTLDVRRDPARKRPQTQARVVSGNEEGCYG